MEKQYQNPKNLPELLLQLHEMNIPEQEYEYHFRSFLEFKARQYGIPLCGKFELTPLCNLDCKMCYVHLNKAQMGQSKLLPKEIWMDLMTQAAHQGMIEAVLTGGECLTYPDFDSIYLHLHELGVEVSLYTNGLLLNEERISFLKDHPPKEIQVSLYGSCEDGYRNVTGHRVFSNVFRNLESVKAAQLPVHIAITPSTFMQGDLDETVWLAHSLGIPYRINWSLFDPRESTGRKGQNMDLSIEDYIRLYKLRRKLSGEPIQKIEPNRLPDFGTGQHIVGKGLYCGGGRSSFSIGYDGKMYICGMLRETIAYPLETGFSESWDIIHAAAKNYPVPCQCVGCEYRKGCPNCVVHHQKGAPPGYVNPEICARTKRMAAEGLIQI